jgi:hypothetical protein
LRRNSYRRHELDSKPARATVKGLANAMVAACMADGMDDLPAMLNAPVMKPLTAFGLFAVTAMLACYAFDRRLETILYGAPSSRLNVMERER